MFDIMVSDSQLLFVAVLTMIAMFLYVVIDSFNQHKARLVRDTQFQEILYKLSMLKSDVPIAVVPSTPKFCINCGLEKSGSEENCIQCNCNTFSDIPKIVKEVSSSSDVVPTPLSVDKSASTSSVKNVQTANNSKKFLSFGRGRPKKSSAPVVDPNKIFSK